MQGKKAWNYGVKKTDHSGLASMAEKNSVIMKQKLKDGSVSSPFTKDWWDDSRRKRVSDEKKLLFKESPDKHPNRIVSNNRQRMSFPERIAFDWLTKNDVQFLTQVRIDNFYADFVIDQLVIEIDGEHWHPEGNEKDKTRDEKLVSLGYNVVRIRSKENIEERLRQIFGV